MNKRKKKKRNGRNEHPESKHGMPLEWTGLAAAIVLIILFLIALSLNDFWL